MGYRVKFQNPETGDGYIEHYQTADRAKQVVDACQAAYRKAGNGIWATYLGRSGTKLGKRLEADRSSKSKREKFNEDMESALKAKFPGMNIKVI